MRCMTRRRRTRLVAGVGAAVAALSLLIPGAAVADPPPEPINPYYFTKEELPVIVDGDYPFELSRDPEVLTSLSQLQSGEPTCAAPPPLPATDDSSPDGYTIPVRIKLTNGTMLAGYSPAAAHWGQAVPFGTQMRGVTGWANARVQVPSMKILVDPADTVICEGAEMALGEPGTAAYPEWDWCTWNESWCAWAIGTQPDGSAYAAPPGTFVSNLYNFSPASQGSTLRMEDIVVNQVEAAVSGMTPGGDLELRVDLDLDFTLLRDDHAPSVNIPLGVSGTFTTAVKAPYAPSTDNVPWDFGDVSLPQHRSYLPAKTLAGATEGSSAAIGSTAVDLDVSRLGTVSDEQAKNFNTDVSRAVYGLDAWGNSFIQGRPEAVPFYEWVQALKAGEADYFAPDHGTTDVSVDMTIDALGLPKGPPSGFGFDQ